MKQFAALARVSSREQECEGFSLDVQEDGLKRYAAQADGEIAKLFRIGDYHAVKQSASMKTKRTQCQIFLVIR